MPSLSDQRKARIMEAVEYGKQFKGHLHLYDKLEAFIWKKHPTLTQPTISDYTRNAVKIIETGHSQQDRATG